MVSDFILRSLKNVKYPIVVLFLVVLALRFQTFFQPVYNGDEANYAGHAQMLLEGGIPYVDFVEKKPPLIYLFYGIIFYLFGPSLEAVHLVTAGWIFLCALTIFGIIRKSINTFYGFVGSFLYVIFISSYLELEIFATNCEILMILPLCVSAYFLLKGIPFQRSKKTNIALFLSGFFCSLGFLFKHQAGINLPVSILFIFLFILQTRLYQWTKVLVKSVLPSLIFLLGFVSPILIVIWFYYKKGVLFELYEWNILSNIGYIGGSIPIKQVFFNGLSAFLSFMSASLLLFISVFILFKKRLVSFFNQYSQAKSLILLATLWFVFSWIPVVMGGRFYGHYFIQVYPPLVILACFWIGLFIQNFSKQSLKLRRLFLIGLFLPPLFFQSFSLIRTQAESFEGAKSFHQEIAEEIKRVTQRNDRIFVWGNYAHPYYFAERKPASRFIISEYVLPYWEKIYSGENNFNISELKLHHKKQFNLLLKDLNRLRPALILDTSTSEHFLSFRPFQIEKIPALEKIIVQNYKFLSQIQGVTFYKRRN